MVYFFDSLVPCNLTTSNGVEESCQMIRRSRIDQGVVEEIFRSPIDEFDGWCFIPPDPDVAGSFHSVSQIHYSS
jgi:hypothetical protein